MADVIFSTGSSYKDFLKSRMHQSLRTQNSFNDSTINFLGDIIGQTVEQNKAELREIYSSTLLSRANGSALDTLVYNMFGLTRRVAGYARSYSTEKNILFYIKSVDPNKATFGSINDGQDILLTKGTLLGVSSDFSSLSNAVYVVLEDTILGSGDSAKYVSAAAVNAGVSSLVSKDTLIHHNFNNYFDSDLNSLKVTNRMPIINGADPESDEDLRNRAKNFIDSQRVGSLESINSSALNIPGVLNTVIIPGYYGIGTTAVVCKGADQESSILLVNDVQRQLDSLVLPGANFIAIPPVYLSINCTLKIRVAQSFTSEQIETQKAFIKQEMYSFFRNNVSSIVNLNSLSRNLADRLAMNSNNNVIMLPNSNNSSVFYSLSLSKKLIGTSDTTEEALDSLFLLLKPEEVLDLGQVTIDQST